MLGAPTLRGAEVTTVIMVTNLNPSPNYAFFNIVDKFSVYTIFFSQSGYIASFDFPSQSIFNRFNLLNRKLIVWIIEPVMNGRLAVSLFYKHIIHIFLMSAKKQMLWVNASPIVARVANAHTFRDFTFANHIGRSVRTCSFSFCKTKLSISMRMFTSNPFPTIVNIVGLGYFFPEILNTVFFHAEKINRDVGRVKGVL